MRRSRVSWYSAIRKAAAVTVRAERVEADRQRSSQGEESCGAPGLLSLLAGFQECSKDARILGRSQR